MTVVYMDMLILLNFVANYLLLLGAGRVAGVSLRRLRIAAGAAVGALYAAAVFLPGAAWLALWPCKIASGVAMPLISYGGGRGLLKVTIIFFAASAGLAGLILAINLLGGSGLILENGVMYSNYDVRLLLLLFVLCYFVMSLFFRGLGKHTSQELLELKIITAKKTIVLTALLDSGHTLTDPVSNRPVIVADYSFFMDELPDGIDPKQPVESLRRCRETGVSTARLVPYRAVGVDCGLLLAVRANSVTVGKRDLGNLLIALSPTPVSDGGSYQALIGGI